MLINYLNLHQILFFEYECLMNFNMYYVWVFYNNQRPCRVHMETIQAGEAVERNRRENIYSSLWMEMGMKSLMCGRGEILEDAKTRKNYLKLVKTHHYLLALPVTFQSADNTAAAIVPLVRMKYDNYSLWYHCWRQDRWASPVFREMAERWISFYLLEKVQERITVWLHT